MFLMFLVALVVAALVTPALAVLSIRYRVFPFLRNSYLFWAVISLYNFNLLAWLAIPPLLLMQFDHIAKFFPFLTYPALTALTVASLASLGLAFAVPWLRTSSTGKELLPAIFNIVLLLVFLLVADAQSKSAIASALARHKPDCVQINPFLSSLKSAGGAYTFQEHALFTEGGKTFFWSYRTLDFFEGDELLSRNFPCSQPSSRP